jgi:hypothetical protein
MSPELERLLHALWEARNGEPKDRERWKIGAERMVADAMRRLPPGTSREEFWDSIEARYAQFRRARNKPPTLPPQA